MGFLLLLRKHAGIDDVADDSMAEGESRLIGRNSSKQISASEAGNGFSRVDSSIGDEVDRFEIGYRESRPHCARDFEYELLVRQKGVGPIQNSSARRLGERYRIIFFEGFDTRDNSWPSFRSALLDLPADFTDEERISP